MAHGPFLLSFFVNKNTTEEKKVSFNIKGKLDDKILFYEEKRHKWNKHGDDAILINYKV